jgi:hypothetical protein
MSAETFAALEAAIAAHVAEDSEHSPIVTGWVMQCTTTSADPDFIDSGMTGFAQYTPDRQNIVTTLGIIDYMHHMVRINLGIHYLDEDDE